MIQQHDPRCDQHHTQRQRCNRHMTPAAARLARLAVESPAADLREQPWDQAEALAPEPDPVDEAVATIDPPEEHAAPVEELSPEPDPVREAVATSEPLEPTVFVSREWSATAEAVEQAYRPSAPPAARPVAQPDSSRMAGLLGLALALLLFVLFSRGHPDA